jgi:hydrogenase nickel incorporation protein HypA/HybF
MHELALAEAVIVTALEAADREGFSELTRIDVRVGELQRIRKDTFEFALKEILPAGEPRIAGAEIRVEIEPVRFRCRPCGREFGSADTQGPRDEDESEAIHFIPELAHAFLRCPGCDSPDFEVNGGRGVTIEALEGNP